MKTLILVLGALPALALAEVHVHVERGSGMTILSNVAPSETAAVKPMRRTAVTTATPADFPTVSPARQKQLDASRKEILSAELAADQQALAQASARQAAEDILRRHLANVDALKRELAGINN